MQAAEQFVKALEHEGVEIVFGVPGEENLDFLEALSKSSIRFIATRHEAGAGFMAATLGRCTEKVGVCLSTLGPGATNLVTPVAYAKLGAMPLLAITGQKPIKQSKQGRFQIVDVIEMMRPLTKMTKQIVNGHTIPAITREAFRLALEERPGPVHLELPEDIAKEVSELELFEIHHPDMPHASHESIEVAAKMIEEAKMPLLLIGANANRKLRAEAIAKFVDKTGIPFCNTQMGKGVIDERHPLYLGTAALSANDYLHCALSRADLIINVGHDVIEKPPFFMEQGGCKVIHINFFQAHIDEVYFPQKSLIGDIANAVERLRKKINVSSNWDFEYYHRIKTEISEQINIGSDDDRCPMLPQRIVRDVRAAMPDDGILALDNGMYKIWFARNYPVYEQHTILLDNALASMGAGMPSAIGASFVYPERKIVALCGDGGFMMTACELETAVRLGIDLVVIVLRDNEYGMIRWKQQMDHLTNYGLDFGNPDFVAFAESFGARGHRVTAAEQLQPLLAQCLDATGIDLIELPIDYSETAAELGEKLEQKTCLL